LYSFSHKHVVKSVDFSYDTNQLITGCNDKILRLFDLNNYSSEPTVKFNGHTSNIKRCLLTIDAKRALSISDDKTLRSWDISSGSEINQIKFNDIPASIEISKDGKLLILAQSKCVDLYDVDSLNLINRFNIPTGSVSAASIHPDKSVFVCSGDDFTLYKYSVSNGTELGN
jgi:serine-threonine kinase receptor-associated protein